MAAVGTLSETERERIARQYGAVHVPETVTVIPRGQSAYEYRLFTEGADPILCHASTGIPVCESPLMRAKRLRAEGKDGKTRRAEVKRRALAGESVADIARDLQTSEKTIRDDLRFLGISDEAGVARMRAANVKRAQQAQARSVAVVADRRRTETAVLAKRAAAEERAAARANAKAEREAAEAEKARQPRVTKAHSKAWQEAIARRDHATHERRARIPGMVADGMTTAEMAAACHTSINSIKRDLQALNLSPAREPDRVRAEKDERMAPVYRPGMSARSLQKAAGVGWKAAHDFVTRQQAVAAE
jgi:DNA-binding NarL/FixJ family response regulator